MSAEDAVAMQMAVMLANGQGGYDWSGFQILSAWLGVQDVEGLLLRLKVIKAHKSPLPEG